jgi:AGZA family xanthine/uracil permease-like MFS transporter
MDARGWTQFSRFDFFTGPTHIPQADMNSSHRYRWATPGDVNAFFGLCLDNLAGLVLTVSLLATVFGFPADFALGHLVPGTAVGVVVGDLLFTWMAFRLAKRTGRTDITAMPLGLDTPSTFGMVFFVLGPAFRAGLDGGLTEAAAARHAWHIGMCSIVVSGFFKLACAPLAGSLRRLVPRAGLLGSLAAIALALITFLPMLEIATVPLVGLISLGIILATLTARLPFPLRIPGALAALLIGGGIHYVGGLVGFLPDAAAHSAIDPAAALWPTEWLRALRLEWLEAWPDTIRYLPIVIPFALGTVVGGIDCTESAAAAGDEYHTGRIIAVEGIATVIAGACGGVIQTTPYIGHPAYKTMGGRAAYTLATAVFIGAAGLTGTFAWLYQAIPGPAILPILVFIGLEITAQSFHATPERHYPAVAIACVPALAALAKIETDKLLAAGAQPAGPLVAELFSIRLLAAGFIVTSLVWAGLVAALIDRNLRAAAGWCLAACGLTFCGVMHSPFPDGRLFLPWAIGELPPEAAGRGPIEVAIAYAVLALLFSAWSACLPPAEPCHPG